MILRGRYTIFDFDIKIVSFQWQEEFGKQIFSTCEDASLVAIYYCFDICDTRRSIVQQPKSGASYEQLTYTLSPPLGRNPLWDEDFRVYDSYPSSSCITKWLGERTKGSKCFRRCEVWKRSPRSRDALISSKVSSRAHCAWLYKVNLKPIVISSSSWVNLTHLPVPTQ